MIRMISGIKRAKLAPLLTASAALFAFMCLGCSDEVTPPVEDPPVHIVSGTLVGTTECKENIYGSALSSMVNLDCVTWEWDGSDKLTVVHVNSALNCCPGTINGIVAPVYIDITDTGEHPQLAGFNITETEGDDAIMCRCLCLYDLSYELTGVTGGVIFVRFYEQYVDPGAEPLVAVIDLNEEPEGSFCVFRNQYPWGTGYSGEDPVGMIEYYSGCKDVVEQPATLPAAADSVCALVVTNPSGGSMHIMLSNTAYNCCVDAIDADFEFSGDVITITGKEHPPGGLCDCVCLYDITYCLGNLEPGLYTIRFVEPYLPPGQEPLEIEVDLNVAGSWSACAYREGYPWGGGSDEASDKEILDGLYGKIIEYIGTPSCGGESDCRYIGVGSKPCGGPWEYLIYSASTVNEEYLLSLVSVHAAFESYMNHKYGYSSDCSVPAPPVVECREGVCREARR
jgi:hypothetical protein